MDYTAYFQGLATLPALALLLACLVFVKRRVGAILKSRGFFLEFGGEDGKEDQRENRARTMRYHGLGLWSGTYRRGFGARPFTSRFLTLAGPKHGVTVGRKRFLPDPDVSRGVQA